MPDDAPKVGVLTNVVDRCSSSSMPDSFFNLLIILQPRNLFDRKENLAFLLRLKNEDYCY